MLFLLEAWKHKIFIQQPWEYTGKKTGSFPVQWGGSHQQPVVPIYRFDRKGPWPSLAKSIWFFWIKRSQIFAEINPIRKVYSQVWLLKKTRPSPCLLNLPISPQFLWTNLRCSLKPNSWKQICASYCGWTKSCTTLWRVYPIMYVVSCFPLVQDFVHPKYGFSTWNYQQSEVPAYAAGIFPPHVGWHLRTTWPRTRNRSEREPVVGVGLDRWFQIPALPNIL